MSPSLKNTILVAGPVIIQDGKVLLNRELQNGIPSPFYMFPGGKLKDIDEDPRDACMREVMEEMGLKINILRPLETLIVKRPDAVDSHAILMHYLAEIRKDSEEPGSETIDWGWFPIDDLPKNCTENVKRVIKMYINEQNSCLPAGTAINN